LTYYAAGTIDEGLCEAPLAVSMAKGYASDVYCNVASAGIRPLGGIEFIWEHDLQLYFKPEASEVAFGDATWHRERVARLLAA
jgi:alkylation response protein AidB-like acyl-CoA dehydrogenase